MQGDYGKTFCKMEFSMLWVVVCFVGKIYQKLKNATNFQKEVDK
jgi:hypothetical protein